MSKKIIVISSIILFVLIGAGIGMFFWGVSTAQVKYDESLLYEPGLTYKYLTEKRISEYERQLSEIETASSEHVQNLEKTLSDMEKDLEATSLTNLEYLNEMRSSLTDLKTAYETRLAGYNETKAYLQSQEASNPTAGYDYALSVINSSIEDIETDLTSLETQIASVDAQIAVLLAD